MISEDRLEKALKYLATTDEECAELKAEVSRREYACKLARARELVLAAGSSVEVRKAIAEQSQSVIDAEDLLANAIVDFEKVKAKRQTEELIVEVWRSVLSARKQGMDI